MYIHVHVVKYAIQVLVLILEAGRPLFTNNLLTYTYCQIVADDHMHCLSIFIKFDLKKMLGSINLTITSMYIRTKGLTDSFFIKLRHLSHCLFITVKKFPHNNLRIINTINKFVNYTLY